MRARASPPPIASKVAHKFAEVTNVIHSPHHNVAWRSPGNTASGPELDFSNRSVMHLKFVLPSTFWADSKRPSQRGVNGSRMRHHRDSLSTMLCTKFVAKLCNALGEQVEALAICAQVI